MGLRSLRRMFPKVAKGKMLHHGKWNHDNLRIVDDIFGKSLVVLTGNIM